jgi:hypothetical protein
MQHSGQLDVVDEASGATQQVQVLKTLHTATDNVGTHLVDFV